MRYYKITFSLLFTHNFFLNFIFIFNYYSFSIQRFLFYTLAFLKSESFLQSTYTFIANILSLEAVTNLKLLLRSEFRNYSIKNFINSLIKKKFKKTYLDQCINPKFAAENLLMCSFRQLFGQQIEYIFIFSDSLDFAQIISK